MLIKIFRITTIICLFLFYKAEAQVSDSLFRSLPDSLKPKNKEKLILKEATDLLNKGVLFDEKFASEFDSLRNHIALTLKKPQKRSDEIIGLYSILLYDFATKDYEDDKTLKIADKIIALVRKAPQGFEKNEFNALLVRATILATQKMFEEALTSVNLALKLKNQITDKKVIAGAYKTLSYINNCLNLPKRSIQNLLDADRVSVKTSDFYKKLDFAYLPLSVASNYLQLYLNTNNKLYIDSASYYINKLKRNYNLKGRWLAEYLVMKGFAEYSQGNYKKSLLYADSSLSINFDLKDVSIIKTKKLALKGFALIKLGKIRAGIKLLEEQQKDPETSFYSALILQQLANAYEILNNFKSANYWFKAYIAYQERESVMKYRGVVFLANEKFLSAEKENTIANLKKEALFKNKQNLYIIYGGLIFILLGIAFLFYRYKINKAHEKRKKMLYAQKILLMNEQLMQQDIKIKAERVEAALYERTTIGKNLHDNLSGSLIALKYLVNDKRNKSLSEKELSNLEIIEEEIDSIYNETRDFSHLLSKNYIDQTDFIYDITTYLEKIKNRFEDLNLIELITNYDETMVKTKLSPKLSENIYHFIKECLSNIIKHSEASRASIKIDFDNNRCIINVSDNGKGFGDINKNKGIGYNNLTSRIENLGGKIIIESTKKGALVIAELPLSNQVIL